MDQEVHTLVASSNAGRYALDTPDGADIVSGFRLEILLGERWIAGHVEHAKQYYFVAYVDGSVCGLCAGMKVRQGRAPEIL